MGCTIDEAQHRLNSPQFAEQMAFDLIELPEPYRTDWRFAFLCSILVSLLGKKALTPAEVYEQMRKYFDRLEDTTETAGEVDETAIKAFIAGKNNTT